MKILKEDNQSKRINEALKNYDANYFLLSKNNTVITPAGLKLEFWAPTIYIDLTSGKVSEVKMWARLGDGKFNSYHDEQSNRNEIYPGEKVDLKELNRLWKMSRKQFEQECTKRR